MRDASQNVLYAYRKAHELCLDCEQPTLADKLCCQRCLDTRSAYLRAQRRLIAKPICWQCGLIRVYAWPIEQRCTLCRKGFDKYRVIRILKSRRNEKRLKK